MRIVACIYVFVVQMRWIAGLGCPTLWIPAYAGMTVLVFAGLGRCWGIVWVDLDMDVYGWAVVLSCCHPALWILDQVQYDGP